MVAQQSEARPMTAICYRTAGGRVTYIDAMSRADVANALARAPWMWAESPRGFAPWPATHVRGVEVELRSVADTSASGAWKRVATS
jgi:hypothetical protein